MDGNLEICTAIRVFRAPSRLPTPLRDECIKSRWFLHACFGASFEAVRARISTCNVGHDPPLSITGYTMDTSTSTSDDAPDRCVDVAFPSEPVG